ncbi:MAG: hypothetical protein WD342_19220 [Verrucomicrobiales bacterium]
MAGASAFKDLALPEFAERAGEKSVYESYGLNPLQTPKVIRETVREIGVYSAIPLLALYGEDCSFTERAPFFHFVETTPAGHTLALQACFARERTRTWARFCHSIRQPGFVHAWFAFCASTRKFDNEPLSDQVKRLRSDGAPTRNPLTKYLAEKARDSIPLPGTSAFDDFIVEQARYSSSERKKQARNKPPRSSSPYKAILEHDYLANALWCRTSSAIVSEYFPNANADEHEKHERELNKAFSTLKLSKARRSDIPECPDIDG